MADPRFFDRLGPLTLNEIAALSGAAISDSASGNDTVCEVAPISEARKEWHGERLLCGRLRRQALYAGQSAKDRCIGGANRASSLGQVRHST